MKTKPPLIDTPDAVVARLRAAEQHERTRWGQPLGFTSLHTVANLTSDGRRYRRNWDLVEALRNDGRVVFDRVTGIGPWAIQIKLRLP